MRKDKKINVSFSASAEDNIRRFMKVADETMPNANLVQVMAWHTGGKFTNKVTGEVRTFGPGVNVGAIEAESLADELIVPMGGLKVAIRLLEELQSADRLAFDFLGRFYCCRRPLISNPCFFSRLACLAAFRTCLAARNSRPQSQGQDAGYLVFLAKFAAFIRDHNLNQSAIARDGRPRGGRRLRARRPNIARRLGFMLAGCALILVPGCASIGLFGAGEPAAEPHSVATFVVSTRKGEGGAASEAAVANGARFSLQMIGVPPGHVPGTVERPAFGSEDPQKHFIARSRRGLDETAFFAELASHISGRIGSNRDVLLYVHGFNTSYDDARFRLAQIADDARFGGVAVLYTWPAAGSFLDYGVAKESATIARDALSKLLHRVSELPDVGRVHILAHSMGAWLAMEALRENAISGSPDLNGKLGDVMLAAPDIDLNVFRQQLARLDPSHVFVLVASNDRALSLSRRLAGDRQRLGALDPNNPSDRAALEELGVKAYDLSHESTGLIGHGTYADAPQAVRTIGAQITERRSQDANVQAVLGEKPVDSRIMAVPLAPLAEPSSAAANPPPGAISPR